MRRTLFAVILSAATHAAFAQIPIVATHTLTPTADDLGDVPQYADVEFGAAVAIDGKRLAVGMTGYNEHAGRVGIYHRTAAGWRRTATLSPSDPGDIFFGRSLDMNGHVLAVAARGASYLFRELDDGSWQQIGRVAVGNRDRQLNTQVAFDNDILAVSRIDYDAEGNYLPGKVYLFRRCAEHGIHPTPVARLQASDGFAGNQFGASLALERGVLVVGAPAAPGAYVFVRNSQGWGERQKLLGSTAGGVGPAGGNSQFGAGVAIRDRMILAGAPNLNLPGDENTTSPEGNAYVFMPSGSGWFESQELNPDGQFYALFGKHVAMGRGMVAVTAPILEAVMSTHGAALVFDWVGQELTHEHGATGIPEGWFATDLDFSGRTVVVGMNEYEFAAPSQIGRVRIVEFAED